MQKVDAGILIEMRSLSETTLNPNDLRIPVIVRTENGSQFDPSGMGLMLFSMLDVFHAMNVSPDDLLRLNSNPIVESDELSRDGGI